MNKSACRIHGLQHVGIPTNNLKKSILFYEGLGFENVYQVLNEKAGEEVAFLRLGNLTLEIYETHSACMKVGAVDHIALDVEDIESVFADLGAKGYALPDEGIQYLPFWENGVRFFTIMGLNKEKVEFCERLK